PTTHSAGYCGACRAEYAARLQSCVLCGAQSGFRRLCDDCFTANPYRCLVCGAPSPQRVCYTCQSEARVPDCAVCAGPNMNFFAREACKSCICACGELKASREDTYCARCAVTHVGEVCTACRAPVATGAMLCAACRAQN